jgi:hypothetical protein
LLALMPAKAPDGEKPTRCGSTTGAARIPGPGGGREALAGLSQVARRDRSCR